MLKVQELPDFQENLNTACNAQFNQSSRRQFTPAFK